MKCNWGIIGAGRFADNVFAPAIKQSAGSRLVAVMARDSKKAENFAKKHEVAKFYDSAEELCSDPQVNAVYIASPTFLHCEHALLAAESGKNILCEKPMAPTLEDCDKMIAAAEQSAVMLMIGHNMRFHQIHQEIRNLVAGGALGRVGIVRAEIITSFKKNQGDQFRTDQFRLNREIGGGGVLFDMGIHAIDVLRYILNDEITEITGFSQNLFIDCNGEDTVTAVLKFSKGTYGTIATSGALPYARNGVEIYGEEGALTTDGSVWIFVRSGEIKIFSDGEWKTRSVEINNCYLAEVDHFVECVAENKTPAVTGKEARQNIQAVLAAYRSMDEGQTIQLDA